MITERIFKKLLYLLLLVFALHSCQDNEPGPDYDKYVSSEFLTSFSQGYIGNLLSAAGEYIPAGYDPGQLVSSAVDVYKVVYETTADGEKINASGIVCVPQNAGSYPVLSFQNGTNTLDSKAPSNNYYDPAYQLIEIIASMGYVVVFADYPGFGESKDIPHPYLVAEETVTALTDMFHAVREMDEGILRDVELENEFYLLGYSQGGWSTMQLHKALELGYADDFTLRGSMSGAGPHDVYKLMERIFSQDNYPIPYYIGYVVNAYKAYGQFTNPISDLLNEPYAGRVPNLYKGILSGGQINSQLTTSITDLVTADFRSGFATSEKYSSVRNSMIANSIAPWKTNIPLLMIHGDSDTHVDVSATEEMYDAMIAAGSSTAVVQKVIIPGADHGDALVPAILQGLLFLNGIRDSK